MKTKDCNENKCLVNMYSKTCSTECEVWHGFCVYKELEYLKNCELDNYIMRSYPGESFDEKISMYNFEYIESLENMSSNFDDEFENEDFIIDYKDMLFYQEIVKLENERYNSILQLESDDEYYNFVYVLNYDNNEVYVSAKYAANLIQIWKYIKPFVKGSLESNFKFLLSQYIENKIKKGHIHSSKIIKDEGSDLNYYNQIFGSANRRINQITEFNYFKNCFKIFNKFFDED